MKTTLTIDSTVMSRLKREAARRRKTMSALVEAALRAYLRGDRRKKTLPPLPKFDSGGVLLDIADRYALYGAMEGH